MLWGGCIGGILVESLVRINPRRPQWGSVANPCWRPWNREFTLPKARDGVARHARAHTNMRPEKRQAGVPQGRAESDTMYSWYDMMKVNWNTLCRTARRRDTASLMIFFKHEEVCFCVPVCVCVCLRACLCVKTYNVKRSCHRNCCHVAVNRLSDLKSQSKCRTAIDLCKVLLRACADVLRST